MMELKNGQPEKKAPLSRLMAEALRDALLRGGVLALILTVAVLALPNTAASSLEVMKANMANPVSLEYTGGLEESVTAERLKEALYWGRQVAAVNRSLTRLETAEIGKAVLKYSEEYGLSPRLIVAVIKVESSGRVRAVSNRGAQGLMQVMPFWKDELGIEGSLFDIDTNIMAGSRIMSGYIKRHGYEEGIARYYRGSMKVDGQGYYKKVHDSMNT